MGPKSSRVRIGTAGWSIPRASAERCGGEGTHLERYARVFPCAEINSSFHRPHAPATYAKWAAAVPRSFRFAVKLPRTITHDLKLRRSRAPLERFLAETAGLGSRRGPLLVQLPPSLALETRVAARFWNVVRERYDGPLVCEPRHSTWFSPEANDLLLKFKVARVAADPALVAGADWPGGWTGLIYYRLHGSPRMYWSKYEDDFLAQLAEAMRDAPTGTDAWFVFDNTASGAALENAWAMRAMLS